MSKKWWQRQFPLIENIWWKPGVNWLGGSTIYWDDWEDNHRYQYQLWRLVGYYELVAGCRRWRGLTPQAALNKARLWYNWTHYLPYWHRRRILRAFDAMQQKAEEVWKLNNASTTQSSPSASDNASEG